VITCFMALVIHLGGTGGAVPSGICVDPDVVTSHWVSINSLSMEADNSGWGSDQVGGSK
jgi:hypothetical protein